MKKESASTSARNLDFKISVCDILQDKAREERNQNIVVFLHGKTLDLGTKDLSILLLKEFFCSLAQQEFLPKVIILSQKTVLCNQRKSEFLAFLRALEQKNIKILTCKTSATYYNIDAELPVGQLASMEEIVEILFYASKIIQW